MTMKPTHHIILLKYFKIKLNFKFNRKTTCNAFVQVTRVNCLEIPYPKLGTWI